MNSSRRKFIQLSVASGLGLAVTLLGACSAPAAPPAPTSKPAEPAKPAEAAKPSEPAKQAAPATAPVQKPAASAETPQPGGELIVGLWQEAASLDPSNANGIAQRPVMAIYDTLIVMTEDFKFHPGLAQSWQAAPDGKSYTFKLKPGVKFHDGTPFNAAAIKATLDYTTRADARATFSVSLRGVYESTEIVDDLTARIILKEPFAPLLDGLSEGYHGMISPAALQKFGKDYDRNPVGTGPFVFQEWVANDHVTVRKNPDYNWGSSAYGHQGPPYLDKITFKMIPEASTRLATLETGEVHMIEEPSLQDLGQLERDKKFQITKNSYPGTPAMFRINVERPPTDELAVRQAMLYAIDQDSMGKAIFHGVWPPSRNVLVPGTFAYDESIEKIYRYDPAKAKDLLEQAGWKAGADGIRQKDGKPLKMSVVIITGLFPQDSVAQLTQAQFREVGIDLSIKSVARPAWADSLTKGDDNLMIGWRGSSDPDSLRPQFHSSTIGGQINSVRIRDPKLDAMLEQGYRAIDEAERTRIYKEVQQYVMQNGLVIPVAMRINTVVAQPKVRGLHVDLRAYPRYYDVWLTK